jgi:hypothetical protein
MQQIQLNIIPFKPVVNNQTFAFYGEKQKGFAPIYWDKLFESFPEGREAKHKNYYSDFQPARPGVNLLPLKSSASTWACSRKRLSSNFDRL